MDKYKSMLYSKNGFSSMKLAIRFISISEGEKIPTVSEFSEKIGLARGTIQNALKLLTEQGAIKLESRGHLGTFLKSKNMSILLSFAGIDSIVGVMPLPYSKRYEGLATGLITGLENEYNIPMSLAYMRGAQNRIGMVYAQRYDFAIISRYAANQIMTEKKMALRIVKSFGKNSYLSNHVLMFHDRNEQEIQNGMRIGVDLDSIDHKNLTEKVCEGKQVEYIPINYNQAVNGILSGDVDAAIWNEDEIKDKMIDVNYKEIAIQDVSDTEAVLVVKEDNEVMATLLNKMISVDTVLKVQELVMKGKVSPSY